MYTINSITADNVSNNKNDNWGIDLNGRQMWYEPWLIDSDRKYISPDEKAIGKIYGISGEAVRETLLYFEKCADIELKDTGGAKIATKKLINMLNQHIIDRCFIVTRKELLDSTRWYNNEYYFYFIMFTKKVMGRYDFHFGEGSEKLLSRYHRPYERGCLKYPPWGKGFRDKGGNFVAGGYVFTKSLVPKNKKDDYEKEIIKYISVVLDEKYARQINKKYLMKEFNWYGWEYFNFLYSLYLFFSNKQDFSLDVPRFYFDNFTSATVLLLLRGASLMSPKYVLEHITTTTTNVSYYRILNYSKNTYTLRYHYTKEHIEIYKDYKYTMFCLYDHDLAHIGAFRVTPKEMFRLEKDANVYSNHAPESIKDYSELKVEWESKVQLNFIFVIIPIIFLLTFLLKYFSNAFLLLFIFSLSAIVGLTYVIMKLSSQDRKKSNAIKENLNDFQKNRNELEKVTIELQDEKNQLELKIDRRTVELATANEQLQKKNVETEKDYEQASYVQRSVLTPARVINDIKELEIDLTYFPMNGKISGDYYNIKALREGFISVLIADAAGHGVQAALSTMQLDVLNKESYVLKYPDERLEHINNVLNDELHSRNFFTAFMLNIYDDEIHYSSAGHPNQYLIKSDSKEIIPLKTRGKFIGMLPGPTYTMEKLPYEKDDLLILFTDGLFEVFNEKVEEFGEDRLLDLIRKTVVDKKIDEPKQLNKQILKGIQGFRGGAEVNDDITVIVIKKR